MKKLTLHLYNKRTFYIMVTVLMLIISTVSYTFSSLVDTNKQVKQDIQAHARGTYDILLRPDQARTDLEQKLNIVEENYVGIGSGGITVDQWQAIKDNPHVEIAAPVASLGLFTSKERTWMVDKEISPIYFEVNYSTSDGVNTYRNKESLFMYDFQTVLHEPLLYPSSEEVISTYLADDFATFLFPPSYHQVVAIDPTEEGKLTNDTFEDLNNPVLDYDSFNDGEYAIPILSLADAQVPISIELIADELSPLTDSDIESIEGLIYEGDKYLIADDPVKYREVIEESFSDKKQGSEVLYEFTPDSEHSPFTQTLLYVDDNNQLRSDEGIDYFGGVRHHFSQRVGYQLEPNTYEIINDEKLSVKQLGIDDVYSAPIYRGMEKVEYFESDEVGMPLNLNEAFEFSTVGTFSIKENQDTLASSPLGIYGGDLPYLKDNPTKTLHPSAVPGSFVTTPAHGLISMDWASQIKGDAPIDAIRVKVAGLDGYDNEAVKLIRQLETEWTNEGFTVDVVAGSSLQELTVEVEGMGEVIQNFTTLGAADTILSSWNILQMILTLFYALVAFSFVGFTFYNLLDDRKEDEQLLAKLGWSQRLINRTKHAEWSRMIGIPGVLAMIAFIAVGFLTNQWIPFFFSLLIFVLTIMLFILVERLVTLKPKPQKRIKGSITKQNVWFYRFQLITASSQVMMMTLLTCFLPFFLINNVEQTTQTRLGIYVHGEIEGVFILVVILLYVLGLITVYQSLQRLWLSRTKEIELFLYLGWTNRTISVHFTKEVLMWSLLSISIGFVISLGLSFVFIDVSLVTILLGLLGISLILSLILMGTIYSLKKQIKRGTRQYGY